MDIKEIYETMDYGTAPESAEEANAWLDKDDRVFGHFIDGKFVSGTDHFETINPETGKSLEQVSQASSADVDRAVAAANRAFNEWSKSSGFERKLTHVPWEFFLSSQDSVVCNQNNLRAMG